MNDPRESMEGAPLLGTPKAAYSNVPKRLARASGVTVVILICWRRPRPNVPRGITLFRIFSVVRAAGLAAEGFNL
jgi:hypothetical protein